MDKETNYYNKLYEEAESVARVQHPDGSNMKNISARILARKR